MKTLPKQATEQAILYFLTNYQDRDSVNEIVKQELELDEDVAFVDIDVCNGTIILRDAESGDKIDEAEFTITVSADIQPDQS